jgi:hypothetical protein
MVLANRNDPGLKSKFGRVVERLKRSDAEVKDGREAVPMGQEIYSAKEADSDYSCSSCAAIPMKTMSMRIKRGYRYSTVGGTMRSVS